MTGLKPSWGRISRYGTFELAASHDHVGPMARSARDVALLYSLLAGHDPCDPTSWVARPDPVNADACSRLDGLRIGYAPAAVDACDPELGPALAEALSVLAGMGGNLRQVTLPDLVAGAGQGYFP